MKYLITALILIIFVFAQDIPPDPPPDPASLTLTVDEIQARRVEMRESEQVLIQRLSTTNAQLEQVRGIIAYLNLLEQQAKTSDALARAEEALNDVKEVLEETEPD